VTTDLPETWCERCQRPATTRRSTIKPRPGKLPLLQFIELCPECGEDYDRAHEETA
jgi:hypothetical protein